MQLINNYMYIYNKFMQLIDNFMSLLAFVDVFWMYIYNTFMQLINNIMSLLAFVDGVSNFMLTNTVVDMIVASMYIFSCSLLFYSFSILVMGTPVKCFFWLDSLYQETDNL